MTTTSPTPSARRTPKIGSLTPEQEASLKPWAARWIANAMSTKAMDADDKLAMVEAVRELYRAAGKRPPPDHRIVFVPSPFVGAFAAGAAAWIWHCRRDCKRAATWAATRAATMAATSDATRAATMAATSDATRAATMAATSDATRAATEDATWAATEDATWAATMAATSDATRAATRAATEAATWAATRAATMAATEAATWAATMAATSDATRAATEDATWAATMAATSDATEAATRDATGEHDRWYVDGACASAVAVIAGASACAADSWRMMNGGNQWSGWVAFLSWWMRVARIDLSHGADLSKWEPYERAATHGGPRWMHEEFCIISDRPEVLTVDDMRRPHGEDGPFCRWRDGTALYAWHGVRVPRSVIERPESITVQRIEAEANEEVRRVMVERYGVGRYLADTGAELVDADYEGAEQGAAPRALLRAKDGRKWLVGTDGSTGRTYYMAVHEQVSSAKVAHESRCGFDESRIKVKS